MRRRKEGGKFAKFDGRGRRKERGGEGSLRGGRKKGTEVG